MDTVTKFSLVILRIYIYIYINYVVKSKIRQSLFYEPFVLTSWTLQLGAHFPNHLIKIHLHLHSQYSSSLKTSFRFIVINWNDYFLLYAWYLCPGSQATNWRMDWEDKFCWNTLILAHFSQFWQNVEFLHLILTGETFILFF